MDSTDAIYDVPINCNSPGSRIKQKIKPNFFPAPHIIYRDMTHPILHLFLTTDRKANVSLRIYGKNNDNVCIYASNNCLTFSPTQLHQKKHKNFLSHIIRILYLQLFVNNSLNNQLLGPSTSTESHVSQSVSQSVSSHTTSLMAHTDTDTDSDTSPFSSSFFLTLSASAVPPPNQR